MFLNDIPIHLTGVVVAALLYFIIGSIWYAPFFFGDQLGKHEQAEKHKPLYRIGSYVGEWIISFIIAYVLALFIQISQADKIVEGIAVALWIWIGFIATTHFSAVLWSRKTIEHFFIHATFMLVGFIAMAIAIIYFGP